MKRFIRDKVPLGYIKEWLYYDKEHFNKHVHDIVSDIELDEDTLYIHLFKIINNSESFQLNSHNIYHIITLYSSKIL